MSTSTPAGTGLLARIACRLRLAGPRDPILLIDLVASGERAERERRGYQKGTGTF